MSYLNAQARVNGRTRSRNPLRFVLLVWLLALPTMAFRCTEDVEPFTGPTYYGSEKEFFGIDSDGLCERVYNTKGFRPAGADPNAKYPLFLYFVGTQTENTGYTSQVASAITKAMAHRNFVALAVGYNSAIPIGSNDMAHKLKCLFQNTPPGSPTPSLRSVACSLPNVDCDNLGIAVWGHSQGGLIAVEAAGHAKKANGESLVRAAWATGIGTNVVRPAALPATRLRVVNGATDLFSNGTAATLSSITGAQKPTHCPASGESECLRPGVEDPNDLLRAYTTGKDSGWVSVQASVANLGSGHCWFMNGADTSGALDNCADEAAPMPAFVDVASTAPWSLEINADWTALTVWANPVP